MNVHIVEKTTGKTATVIKTHLGGMNYEPARKEWEDEAWRAAVEDGAVAADERENYEFRFVDE